MISPPPLLALIAAVFGLCVGSFLNVVVWRLPRRESVVWPGSHCPHCGHGLPWFHNIPLLSWLLLKGRCGFCSAPISIQYPALELLSSGLWVLLTLPGAGRMGSLPPMLNLLAGGILISQLLPLALIDARTMRLPEPLCRWGVMSGLCVSAAFGVLQGNGAQLLLWHATAAATGLLAFEAISALAERILGVPALGLGDAKLAALLGAWLGLRGLGLAIASAVILGALFGVVGRLSGRLGPRQPFPFGPFLVAGGVLSWVAADTLAWLLLQPERLGV